MTRAEWAALAAPQVPTLNSGMPSAALCNANGWKTGTTLAADDGTGVTVIRITAIGETNILGIRDLSAGRVPTLRIEASAQLHNHDWRKVPA